MLRTLLHRRVLSAAYLDASLPLEQRVNDLVSRMSLEEKVSQMQDVAPAIPRLAFPPTTGGTRVCTGWRERGMRQFSLRPLAWRLPGTRDLIHRVAEVISTEARAKYNDAIQHGNTGRYYGLTFWSPHQYFSRPAVGTRPGNLR